MTNTNTAAKVGARTQAFLRTEYRSYSHDLIPVEMTFGQVRNLFRAIKSPLFMHARTRQWCRQDMTSVYHRDKTSPTGVMRVAGGADIVVNAICRRVRKASPLSPTEGLS